jgi:signal transduction histidine kinase
VDNGRLHVAAQVGYNPAMSAPSIHATPNLTCQFVQDLGSLVALVFRSGDENAILQRILDIGVTAMGGQRGFLALVQHMSGELVMVATFGDDWNDVNRKHRLQLSNEQGRGITGHVALTGDPYITGNVSDDPYYLCFFEDVQSEVAVPIMGARGQRLGVINIESSDANAFNQEHVIGLQALAQVAATALNVSGFRARETALIEIGQSLATTLDEDRVLSKVVDVTASALHFEDCSVFLTDERAGALVLRATRGRLNDQVGRATYKIGEGITGWVAQHAHPARVDSVSKDDRWRGVHTEFEIAEIGPLLAAPIISRDKVIGVLRVLRRKMQTPWFTNEFTFIDERVLVTIANQLGAAIENARSFEKVLHAERMAAWGELSAKSAHMIGNRTFALKGDLNELEHLVNLLPKSEQKSELVNIERSMTKGVERLEEILREFRDFVVATQLALAPTDTNALLREVVAESFPKRSNVKLVMDLQEGLPVLRCDAGKLKRAFSELIENSVSFQPDGGTLTVRSRILSEDERAAQLLMGCRYWVAIEFSDAGPGVPAEIKERIFQPFFTSRVKGMGLGLSIVKGIIDAHQGHLQEVGVPGEGALFQVLLPTCEG